jgi:hypothetical protein
MKKINLDKILSYVLGGYIPYNMARPLMVRQLYSVAVPSTRGRLHPLDPEGREAWRERWSSPCRRDGEVEKTPSLMVKKDGMILNKVMKVS